MPNALRKDSSILKEPLIQSLKSYDYRFKRYQISYSVALLHCCEDVNFNEFSNCVRCTDRFITLDDHTCAIIFDYTDMTTGMQAANNLLEHFKGTFSSAPFFTSIVNANHYEEIDQMVPELFEQLNDSIENNRSVLSS